jgi:hypothetical protein
MRHGGQLPKKGLDKMSNPSNSHDREDCSAGFQPGDEGGPGRGNKVRGQNDLTVKPNETAKQVGEQVGKSEKTVRRGSSQGIQAEKLCVLKMST